jgi:hypothetical protein
VLREDYSHAGQEPTVRDIEGTVGALLIYTPASMAGTEIEAIRVDTPPRHVAVIARHTGERVTHTAVFRALPEGRYQLHCKPDGPVRLSAIVIGGRITETRWPDAGGREATPEVAELRSTRPAAGIRQPDMLPLRPRRATTWRAWSGPRRHR